MRLRITAGKVLIGLGNFVKSLAVVMMKPSDLIELGRHSYMMQSSIENFNDKDLLNEGLRDHEMKFFRRIPKKPGRILVLGSGGGREALFFARHGFSVTAIDFVPNMVENAVKNAKRLGYKIEGLVQELTELDLPESSFDIIWLSSGMYSSIPSRKKRIKMLKTINVVLKPGGYFSCQFHWDSSYRFSVSRKILMKFFAFLFLGNISYESGDVLWGNKEFIHIFSSEDILQGEFNAGGFKVVELDIFKGKLIGGALLRL